MPIAGRIRRYLVRRPIQPYPGTLLLQFIACEGHRANLCEAWEAMEFDLESAAGVLRRTPAMLAVMLRGLGPEWIRATEGPETFSPFDVVGHLIDGEETDWIPRARIILERSSDPRFEPYDRFRHRNRNVGRTLDSLLDEFARLRAQNIELLNSWRLGQEQLDLRGIHPSLGPVTLRQLLSAWVVHDLGHIAQIARVMAKQYRPAVGPWVPYLPVLTDHQQPRS
jgi:DinB family protein